MNEELLENEEIIIDRYYYKDSKGNYYSYKQEHDNLIPITEQEFNEHIAIQPKQYNTEQIQARNRIRQLKKMLADTDYQAIKFAEGQLTAEEYASMRTQRQSWRDEINQLEAGLTN